MEAEEKTQSKSVEKPKIQRAILLDKLTRWEVLCEKAASDQEIEKMKNQFPGMFETYRTHIASVQYIIDILRNNYNVHLDVVKAQRNKPVFINDVDAIISAGGDGTFLEAASLISYSPIPCENPIGQFANETPSCFPSTTSPCVMPLVSQLRPIWVFGINTDPSRSEGRLLLQTMGTDGKEKCSFENSIQQLDSPFDSTISELRNRFRPESHHAEGGIGSTLSKASLVCMNYSICKIIEGTFKPIKRRRIRVTIIDPEPTEQLTGPPGALLRREVITRRQEDRHLLPTTQSKRSSTFGELSKESTKSSPNVVQLTTPDQSDFPNYTRLPLRNAATQYWDRARIPDHLEGRRRIIEYKAVNDVFVTGKESHLSMYVEIIVDGGPPQRSKNSGVIICTGSGSSAWAYNVSKVTEDVVSKILENVINHQQEDVKKKLVIPSVKALCNSVNSSLVFDPEEPQMRFVVRDPIDNRVFSTPLKSGFCNHICLRPLNAEVHLSLDGLTLIPVKFGQIVVLEVHHDEDALLTGN